MQDLEPFLDSMLLMATRSCIWNNSCVDHLSCEFHRNVRGESYVMKKTKSIKASVTKRLVCAECQRTIVFKRGVENYYFTIAVPGEDEAVLHPKCFAIGDGFDDLEWRTRWLLRLVSEAFQIFLKRYDKAEIPSLAAGFVPDLSRDLWLLLAQVAKIQEQASKLSPEETAALFLPWKPPTKEAHE